MFSKDDIIGPYKLIRKLGSGAFGEVWLGRHKELELERAIKIPTDPDYVRQLRQEGKIQAQIRHPNIVETIDLNTEHDPPYFVMEYVEGQDLRKRLKAAGGKLPLRETLDIMRQILGALKCAHSEGVLHRDLKPENILLTPDGRVKVTDFGLGKIQADVAQSLLLSGSMMSSQGVSVSGTLQYMSPEQQSGKDADSRDDVYSVGIIGCELLTGRRPTGAGIVRAMIRCGIDRAVGDLFEKASDEPEYRYKSAGEMQEAIVSLLSDTPAGQAGRLRHAGLRSGSRAELAASGTGNQEESSHLVGRGESGNETGEPEPGPLGGMGRAESVCATLPSISNAAAAVLVAVAAIVLGGILRTFTGWTWVSLLIVAFSQVMAALVFGCVFRFFRWIDLLWIGVLWAVAWAAPAIPPRTYVFYVLDSLSPLWEIALAIGLSFILSRRLHGSVLSHAMVQIPLWLGMWGVQYQYGYLWTEYPHYTHCFYLPFAAILLTVVFAVVEALAIYLVVREEVVRSVLVAHSTKRWPLVYVRTMYIIAAVILAWLLGPKFLSGMTSPKSIAIVLLSVTGLFFIGAGPLGRPCCFVWLRAFAFAFLSCSILLHFGAYGVGVGFLTGLLAFWPVLLLPAMISILRQNKVRT